MSADRRTDIIDQEVFDSESLTYYIGKKLRILPAVAMADENNVVFTFPAAHLLLHRIGQGNDRFSPSPHLSDIDEVPLIIYVKHGFDIDHRSQDRRCFRYSSSSVQMEQILNREIVYEIQLIVLDPVCHFLKRCAALLHHDRLMDEKALSQGCREGIDHSDRTSGILAHDLLRCNLCATTGVSNAHDIVKLLLAGANAIQVASCLYRNGIEYMKELNSGLQGWMEQKGYDCIDQFRGKLALKQTDKASMLMRTQFMNYFADIK